MKEKSNKKREKTSSALFQKVENQKVKPTDKKKRKRDKGLNVDSGKGIQLTEVPKTTGEEEENIKIKPIGEMKKRRDKGNNDSIGKVLQVVKEENFTAEGKKIKNKSSKEKRRHEKKSNARVGKSDKGSSVEQHDDGSAVKNHRENQGNDEATHVSETRASKSKKSKKRRKEHGMPQESKNVLEKKENSHDDAYCISSGEDDCSKGMKKWLTTYHQSRPGLKVLQQRIDDFINAHEEKLERERKEREEEAAKDGWTVVVHHKGRKKTTDSESGITVGSVAPAVAEKLGSSKKHKEVNLEFYRFQKRESQRNEILALQSKFEQDKKRIQQLRAARKFKPY